MQSSSVPVAAPRPLLAAPVAFFGGVLVLLTLSRAAHVLWLRPRVAEADGFLGVFLGGLRMDVLVLSMFTAPALLATLVLGGRNLVGRGVLQLVRAYLAAAAVLFVLLEAATPSFILEYDRRPDRLFIEYLAHPKEVFGMLLAGYKLQLLGLVAVTATAALLAWRGFGRLVAAPAPMGPVRRGAWLVALLPLLFLGARSSVGHRPANPSSVAFAADHLVNDLALSSGYSVLYAAYSLKDEADAGQVYGELESDAAMLAEVRAAMLTVPPEAFFDAERPTLHRHEATRRRERPLNLVVLLEESLGAQFCAALGGRPLTQHLDRLAAEGWWFERMYATGTRSVRGIEAVVSGYLPTPARSVVKLGGSQTDFFTLAELLGRHGYRTQFIYGGEAHFDNMRRFFTGNGFQQIIEEQDFTAPVFRGTWGVSDEDIFERLHQELLAAGDAPLFSLAFSVSNHDPWEFPEGGFEPFERPGPSRENAVRYADAALGGFFAKAKAAPYWERTVFLVVADHDARVFGASLVPVEHFHIPALILGADVAPRRDARLASQIDLPPTLLSLIGLDCVHPMIGHDLTRLADDAVGRAVMQYDDNQAYLAGDQAVVLQPGHGPAQFTFDGAALTPAPLDAALARRALAHALLPSYLYRERLYDLPSTP